MTENLARRGTGKAIGVKDAKAKVIELIQAGHKVAEACAVVGRTEATYLDWRKRDPEFRAAIDAIRSARADERRDGRPEVPDFPAFCAEWLDQPLYPHQLRMLDVIEGKEPRDMHESMDYTPGYKSRVLINIPPYHAKSTTFTVNYVVWLIHKNPDIRVVIVSKGTKLASDFLYEIKQKLTSSQYREMHLRFAPEGGWKDEDGSWTNDRIYVRGKNEKGGVQKDPTVQTVGLKGQIYGRRADLIILDDIVDADNSREIDSQLRKINRDVSSRLPSEQNGGGLLLALGTRIAPMDIYRTLMDATDGDGNRVWTYFRQPAVLDYGTGASSTWVTLWPEMWSGPSLAKQRVDAGWNLYYQQLDVDDDMVFKAEAVNAAINNQRLPGAGGLCSGPGARVGGLDGLYLVAGLDPAATGNTAIVIAGLDPFTNKRYVIDGWNQSNATSDAIIKKIKEFTDAYRLREWVIERNGVQRFIAQLPEIQDYVRARGCKIREHYTTNNKWDSNWGVQTMGPLFDSCVEWDETRHQWMRTDRDKHLIELPSQRNAAWMNDLIQQLTIWQPDGMTQRSKTDLVMALWFTHIAFEDQLKRKHTKQTHMHSAWLSPAGKARQGVVDLAELRYAKLQAEII